jgi:N-succinyl-L-ornithine transcarbamylase
MHCLPVRRNVVVADAVIDSPASLVLEQAANREVAAQTILKKILGGESKE